MRFAFEVFLICAEECGCMALPLGFRGSTFFEGRIQMIRKWISRRPGTTLLVLILVLIYALGGSWIHFSNPLPIPFPDRGHRTFEVADRAALELLASVLEVEGLKIKSTFHVGPTHQAVMSDDTTVLMYFDPDSGFGGPGISLPVDDPMESAQRAKATIEKSGEHTATIREITDVNLPSNHLVVVTTDAFGDLAVVLRKPIGIGPGKMPRPPSGLE